MLDASIIQSHSSPERAQASHKRNIHFAHSKPVNERPWLATSIESQFQRSQPTQKACRGRLAATHCTNQQRNKALRRGAGPFG